MPLISDMVKIGTKISSNNLLMLINADIILPIDFLKKISIFTKTNKKFLTVGHRWDMDVCDYIDFFNPKNAMKFWNEVELKSKKHSCSGMDYFLFRKGTIKNIPDFAIGRFGWDNWILWYARRNLIPLVDATEEIKVVHQNHIYVNHKKVDLEHNSELSKNNSLNILDSNYALSNGLIRKKKSKEFINRNLGKLPIIFPELRTFLIIYKKMYRRLFINK